jgi:hypothetical protein
MKGNLRLILVCRWCAGLPGRSARIEGGEMLNGLFPKLSAIGAIRLLKLRADETGQPAAILAELTQTLMAAAMAPIAEERGRLAGRRRHRVRAQGLRSGPRRSCRPSGRRRRSGSNGLAPRAPSAPRPAAGAGRSDFRGASNRSMIARSPAKVETHFGFTSNPSFTPTSSVSAGSCLQMRRERWRTSKHSAPN